MGVGNGGYWSSINMPASIGTSPTTVAVSVEVGTVQLILLLLTTETCEYAKLHPNRSVAKRLNR